MKGQSKKHSLIEAGVNVSLGYGIAVGSQMVIFPIFDINIPTEEHLVIGAFFTVVSLIRSYTLRRLFNALHTRGL